MKVYDCIQGTSEWAMLRAGIPTASQFHRIVTPKGAASKSQDKYLHELLAERLTDNPTDDFKSGWMERGKELEAEAVSTYEFTRDVETVKVGFVTNDAGTIGASPDRFVLTDGQMEVKIPKPANHVGYLLKEGDAYADHKIQVQGQLWITEREWNDLLSYCPGLPFALHRTERDDDCIEHIATEVEAFVERLEELWAVCVQRGWAPKPRPQQTPVEQVREALRDLAAQKR